MMWCCVRVCVCVLPLCCIAGEHALVNVAMARLQHLWSGHGGSRAAGCAAGCAGQGCLSVRGVEIIGVLRHHLISCLGADLMTLTWLVEAMA